MEGQEQRHGDARGAEKGLHLRDDGRHAERGLHEGSEPDAKASGAGRCSRWAVFWSLGTAPALRRHGTLCAPQHPHIVSILDAFLDGNDMVLVLECCEGGDLAGVLQQCAQKKQPLSEAEVWKWFAQASPRSLRPLVASQSTRMGYLHRWTHTCDDAIPRRPPYAPQVCDAVFHMHSLRMMHRDIKPSNIFVTGTGDVMLGDLGLSRFLSSQTVQVQSMVGTPCYMSPEVTEDSHNQGDPIVPWVSSAVSLTLPRLITPRPSGAYPTTSHPTCGASDACSTSSWPSRTPSSGAD